MGSTGNHCSFVLLAEFHILEGAQLKYQFPQPLGIDESVLAMSMLPDGAEAQLDDWTVFFLNQQKFNTISPVLALDTPESHPVELPGEQKDGVGSQELLCVLNLVRTKHDKTLDRGAKVLALAICTRHPFIQIFKPFLLMALDDYFLDPSQDCLARLFDAVNSIDLSGAPKLTRHEKMVMRCSERKDIFAEKFAQLNSANGNAIVFPITRPQTSHRTTNSGESYSSFEEDFLIRGKERDRNQRPDERMQEREGARSRAHVDYDQNGSAHGHGPDSPSDSSGGAGWTNEENGEFGSRETNGDTGSVSSINGSNTLVGSSRKRRSTDASSSSSHAHSREQLRPGTSNYHYHDAQIRHGVTKDTHFYHAVVPYKDHNIPIKMPLSIFSEEVGDYSLITLIKVFSIHQQAQGPPHPHLHTNGPQTHPIIVLFNALITGKRVIFLGHRRPAGEVSGFVLAACALASGCGAVLRGFIERAFPYANLNNRDDWESVPAYIAGVTNPIFESNGAWDVLLDIGSGLVTVSRDIHINHPPTPNLEVKSKQISRTGTLKSEASVGTEDEMMKGKDGLSRSDFIRADNNADKIFIDDIRSAIEDHFGESLVRVRFTDYVARFVRLASRYEEETNNTTVMGFPSSSFVEGGPGRGAPQLGSGMAFADEGACIKELNANAARIDAWKKTNSYQYCKKDFAKYQSNSMIKGFDILHQLFRLRTAKNIPDAEVLAITTTLAENVKTYEQAIELLACLMPHTGGLTHLGFGLFHQREAVRDATVELFNQLRAYPVGVIFLQALNHFQRYAYVRQAHARERKPADVHQEQREQRQQQHQEQRQQQQQQSHPSSFNRSHSNSIASYSQFSIKRTNGAF